MDVGVLDKVVKGFFTVFLIIFIVSIYKMWLEVSLFSFAFLFYSMMYMTRHKNSKKDKSGLKDDFGNDILIGDKVEFFNGMVAGQNIGHIGTVFREKDKIIVKDDKGHIINYDLNYSKFKVVHLFWRHKDYDINVLSAVSLPSIIGWRKKAIRYFSEWCPMCRTFTVLQTFGGQRLCPDCIEKKKKNY